MYTANTFIASGWETPAEEAMVRSRMIEQRSLNSSRKYVTSKILAILS
ncbi:hypothetical protein [Nostoc parmelioides]|uniref:Uncharacterized protein n=1 Tax=Nostoc parmelioides FACHB-3921 TaxID=2692909 RepID=A0ABR8BQ46_9NOSO|nr:hypothetical protein [Nostoc parmelioides]MBD2255040.1 hypothetical protein [Nostoc parmelioides FACHB-3921]